ncbi:bifunctional 4-hydroxy-2-oxoglutarate aldolase/2-dehydro-3-deoxy-phosphogluconate aldolase [Galbibacter sp. EGI 63066]|uniref:bifunctional 4-hydroxy-2-oxoglutarate aldolase/2-dehydro-3-deoxy-phosphogluconate aldolase n=1 Tax=Galbibacter sp. EGI 63066 TaxID=2993559 RepID=UPI002248E709|nr:bifunctional 4-hydroxy-2-oxoglutarate aldolase/2-dehydro-3-deoxy-phosphogluconate aldolase [Galbibacter sp. EGI 63066]MCX2681120.1 bifunctional 4-hydroxy-2-oxoglutarate aldolase/2-dehydro-3-deoxy-phosphogluconate aldolase [Galbibacter sp. EGI 63066]
MASHSRIQVVQEMYQTGIIPVFYHSDSEVCKKVVQTCYEAGVRVFEFTNRGDFAHEVFAEVNKYVVENLPGMIMGVGSVVEAGTASIYMQLGANFIVAPLINEEVAKACNRRKVAWMPGCGTVTEISYAEELGAEVVKIFPGTQVGGPGFVKAVKGPMPWTNIMPTGGVQASEEGLKPWFDAGVHCVGVGSQVFTKKQDGTFDYKQIELKLKEAIEFVKKQRG